jgi:hypothetical protein
VTALVQWTELPEGEDPATLAPPADPSLRVIQGLLAPDTSTGFQVEHELLMALGKRSDVTGGLARDDGARYVSAWLQTYRTEWIVMFSAQDFTPHTADAVMEPCVAGGARLLLVADSGYGLQTGQVFQAWGPDRVDYRAWAAEHQVVLQAVPLAERGPASEPEDPWQSMTLPRTDWPWFRATCRDTLAPDEFALVDALYLKVVRAMRAVDLWLPPTGQSRKLDTDRMREPILAALVDVADGILSPNPGLVVLRAAQAALVPRGILIRAEAEPFLATLSETSRPPVLTAAQWRSLRAYRDPWRPAAAALLINGLSAATIHELSCREVFDARTRRDRTLRGSEFPSEAWEYVVAQLLVRQEEGASGNDPYFDMGASALSYARRALRNDFAISPGGYEKSNLNETLHETWLRTVRRRIQVSDIR